MQVRNMIPEDWPEVEAIYQQGIELGIATFATSCPSYEEFDQSHDAHCRYVAVEQEKIVGWIAISPISNRCVYAGVAEASLYIDVEYRRRGIGKELLAKALLEAEALGYWTIQAHVIKDNEASIQLFSRSGFRIVGYRENIGKDRDGIWRNTVLLEKRSQQIK